MEEINNKFQDYLKNPNKLKISLNETNPEDVFKQFNNLNINKGNRIYDISPKLIKIGVSRLKFHIAFIFNECLTHGIFSDILKTVIVYPIHKGESKHQFSKYRPISILPILSKIF